MGITSDAHWQRFCTIFGYEDLKADSRLTTNNDRVDQRAWFIPEIQRRLVQLPKADIMAKAEAADIPYAPIARPEDLFEDPHLNQSGGLLETTFPNGRKTKMPKIPLKMNDYDFGLRYDPPAPGEGSEELLRSLGYDPDRIAALKQAGVVGPFLMPDGIG